MLTPAYAKLICPCTHHCAVMQVLLNAFLWEFSMHILFIDDNAVFANALSEMLEEQNIQVDQAECGGSGLEPADI